MSRGFTRDWLKGCGEADRLEGQCGEAVGGREADGAGGKLIGPWGASS